MSNDLWRLTFPDVVVKILPRIELSYHHPLLISLNSIASRSRIRPFRFESAWMTHDTYKDTINNCWDNANGFPQNLCIVEYQLKKWNENVFGSIRKRTKELLTRLGGIQKK